MNGGDEATGCQTDGDCDCGTHCDTDAGHCVVDCLATDPTPDLTCQTGKHCTVRGRCELDPHTPPPPHVITIALSEAASSANTATQVAVVPIGVTISATSSLDLGTAVAARVHLDIAELREFQQHETDDEPTLLPVVKCGNAADFAATCDLDGGWLMDASADGFHSQPRQVLVQIPITTDPIHWRLEARSENGLNIPIATIAATPVANPPTDPGHYTGKLIVPNTGAETFRAQVTTIPIEAYVSTDSIVVVEPTRVFLPEGQIVLPRDRSRSTQLNWLAGAGSAAPYKVPVHITTAAYDATTGHLDATVEMSVTAGVEPILLTLSLDRDRDAIACPTNACTTGTYCNTAAKMCVPGSAPPSGESEVDAATAPSSSVASAEWSAWTAALTAAGSSSILSGSGFARTVSAYCYKPGMTAPSFGNPAVIDAPHDTTTQDELCTAADINGPTHYPETMFAFENRPTEYEGSQAGATFDLYATCLAALTAQPPAAGHLVDDNACASLGRFFLAMMSANGTTPTDVDRRIVMQILRQYLGAHAYLAATAVQSRAYDNALSPSATPANQALGQAVDKVDAGLRVLLDDGVGSQYMAAIAQPQTLRNPDYRTPLRPVARWSFSDTAATADSEGADTLQATGTIANGRLTAVGGACQTTQDIGFANQPFSISAMLDYKPPSSDPIVLLDKLAPNGERLWLDARAELAGGKPDGSMVLALHDATTTLALGSVPPGLLAIAFDGAQYHVYSAPRPNLGIAPFSYTAPAGGPRWGAAGKVTLACDLPVVPDQCTSWDRDSVGDGLGYTLRPASGSHSPTYKQTCITTAADTRCTETAPGGLEPIQASCNTLAASMRASDVADISLAHPNPSPDALGHLVVTGTYEALTSPPPVTGPTSVKTYQNWRCNYVTSGYPDPTTGFKPVCGAWYDKPAWDEVSIWDRALTYPEFLGMTARYGFVPAHETLPAKPTSKQEQAVALPAHLLEAASADLDLLDAYIAAERLVIYGECDSNVTTGRDRLAARAGANLRLVTILEARAEALAAVAGNAPWRPRYTAAHSALAGRRTKVFQNLSLATACNNPLGIAEDNIPLYIGDAIGTNEKFFASSQFLENQAQVEIGLADSKLGAARSAYTAQRMATYQLDADREQKDRRIADLTSSYNSQLIRFCGTPTSGAGTLLDRLLADGDLTPENCFIKTGAEDPACEGAGTGSAAGAAIPDQCLRGDLGTRVEAMKAAAIAIDTANHNLQIATARFDLDTRYCGQRAADFDGDDDLLREHNDHMSHLREEIEIANLATGFVKTMVDSASHLATAPGEAISFVGSSIVAALQDKMQEEQDSYALESQERREHEDIEACLHQADLEKFSIETAGDTIAAATHTVIDAEVEFEKDKNVILGILELARGQLATEGELDATPPHLHYWLDDEIAAYSRHLEYARRLTYLTVRAFEYESQQSIAGLRDRVLSAPNPDALRAVISEISGHTVPLQGVAGASPESPTRILGVRDDILQLEDRSTNTKLPTSERLTPQQQFTNFLISDASKIVDAQGRFIGHGIRFAIRPNGWGQTRCAERIWRIMPSIQMDDPQTDHGLTLYQENAFGSQDCRGETGDLTITRAENTTDLLTGDIATFVAPSAYSVINIDGRPTQSVDDLSAAAIDDSGAGFAGRGMYGNYVLLFPSETWSIDRLEKVKEVLLRFDVNDLTHAAPL